MRAVLASAMVLAAGAALAAKSPMVVATGTDGLAAVPVVVVNAGTERIGCDAAIAHWYSASLGEAAPGARLERTLWSDPQSGAVYLLNDKDERMPVQTLWCGLASETVSTRYDIAIERRSGGVEPAIGLVCAGMAGGRLDCRRD